MSQSPLSSLSAALAAAAVGLAPLGALAAGSTSVAGGADALLAWLAVSAAAIGFAWGGLGFATWPYGLAVPGLWMIALAALQAAAPAASWRDPLGAALVPTGLFLAGAGGGALLPRLRWRGAGVLLLFAGLLVALPTRAGLGGRTARSWGTASPALAARLLDLSPASLAFEAAGADWMRHPAVYGPAGSDFYSDRRRSYALPGWLGGSGGGAKALAAPAVLLVGCTLALGGARARRRATSPWGGTPRDSAAPRQPS